MSEIELEAATATGKVRGKLHPLSIFRHSSKFSALSLVGYGLSIPVSIFVAGTLGPENYGIVGLIGLWIFYANLAKPGLLGAASREMPHLLGEGKAEQATQLQNVAISWESIYYVIPTAVIAASSLFFDDPVIKTGLLLTALAFALTILETTYGSIQWVHQRFSVITKVKFIQTVVTPLLMVGLVLAAGVYGVLIVPIVMSIVISIFYIRHSPKLGFKFEFDKASAIRLLKIGVVLQLLALVFWTFRTLDRTLVAAWFSLAQLGYYSFALNFQLKLGDLISDFGRVLQTVLWRQLGTSGDASALKKDITLLALVVGIASAFLANISQASFGALVYWFLPKFSQSIPLFEILCFDLFFIASTIMPTLVLESSLINRQKMTTLIWSGGLLLVIGTAFLFSQQLGMGPAGVAWGFLAAQIAVAVVLFKTALVYILKQTADRLRFYVGAVVLITLMASTWALLIGPLAFDPSNIAKSLILRSGAVIAIWGAFSAVVWFAIRRRGDLGLLLDGRDSEGVPPVAEDNNENR